MNDARNTHGATSAPFPSPMINEASGGIRPQEFELPTALLRQAIASTLTGKTSMDHSELMDYLQTHNGALDSRSQILIDADLAARA
jgi:hypothetical protein